MNKLQVQQMQENGGMHPHPDVPLAAPTPTTFQGQGPSIPARASPAHFRGRGGVAFPPAAPRGGRGTPSTVSSFSGAGTVGGVGVGIGIGRGRGRGASAGVGPTSAGTTTASSEGVGIGEGQGHAPQKRAVSPLPPNVPTGPKNPGNRYKDRDNNAPAVDGLDYGGGGVGGGRGGSTERESEEKTPR